MSMIMVVLLNLSMSLLAFGAVAAGVLVARPLRGVSADDEGRAEWRGPHHAGLSLINGHLP